MPYVDLPKRNLHQYYTVNPTYETPLHALIDPEPPSGELDDRMVVCFAHAGTSSSEAFISQFMDPRLRSAFNLVSFDSRYYGRTTGPALDYYQDLEERAEEMLDAIDAVIGERPFVMFGESFVGAHIVVRVAASRPKQVRAMIMISPAYFSDPPETIDILENQWLPLCCVNKEGKGDGSGDLPQEALAIVANYFFCGVDREPERQQAFLDRYQYNHRGDEGTHILRQLIHWFKRSRPSSEVFEKITCPTLIFEGTTDADVSPDDAAKQWYEALSNVDPSDKRIERIHGGTHLLATTDANVVNRVVLKFLERNHLG
ncbi:hypothetical protein JCM10212_001026 [Sporobolomyces blumeae]